MRRKQFDTGLRELTEEGAAQVFYAESEAGPAPIVGAVGMLQFDVMQFRLEHEYGAPVRFERISYRYPRWVTGPEKEIERIASARGRMRLYDAKGNPLILFEDEWNLRWALQNETKVAFHEVAP
jgi:peptide chain release factor 3